MSVVINIAEVRRHLTEKYNLSTTMWSVGSDDDLKYFGVAPTFPDPQGGGELRWTVKAGPFAVGPAAGGERHLANLGVFTYKFDEDDGELAPQMFDRHLSDEEAADRIAEYAQSVWRYPDSEDLEDPSRTFFSGEWLVVGGVGHDKEPRWEWAVEGTLVSRWSGGCNFLTDQDAVEHIIREQPTVTNSRVWFQWHGDTLVMVHDDDPTANEPDVQLIEPQPGGEYEMGFGWTWYDVDPLQCDYVIPSSMNWQNIVAKVESHNAVDTFLSDPGGWLAYVGVKAPVSAGIVNEAVRRLRQEQRREDTIDNPNVNCLEGMRCPSCGSTSEFEVSAHVWAMVQDDGITDERDPQWSDDAATRCTACQYRSTWGKFRQRPTWTAGQIIEWLRTVPAETPVLAYGAMDYLNIDGLHYDPENDIAVTIETRNDYDTRQW